MGANLVFGQGGSFTSGACDFDSPNGSAEDLCNPSGTAVDVNGNLYVADTQNNRVLEYDQPVIAGSGSRNQGRAKGIWNRLFSPSKSDDLSDWSVLPSAASTSADHRARNLKTIKCRLDAVTGRPDMAS